MRTYREVRAEKLAKTALDYLIEVGEGNKNLREWLALVNWSKTKDDLQNRFLKVLP